MNDDFSIINKNKNTQGHCLKHQIYNKKNTIKNGRVTRVHNE